MNIKNLGNVRALLVGTGVLVAVTAAGCSGGVTASGQVSNGQTPTTSSSSTTPVVPNSTGIPTGGSGSAGTGGASGAGQGGGSGNAVVATSPTPLCKAGTLAVSFGGADAGMSQQERVLRFTNTGKRSCVISGFPGVSYVTGDNGRQVGAAAVRTGTMGGRITLAPGAVASTVIHSVDPGVFDTSACQPTPVRGYRVYAPDDKSAMFIALPTGAQGCAGKTPDPQLGVVTIKPGPGNPNQP